MKMRTIINKDVVCKILNNELITLRDEIGTIAARQMFDILHYLPDYIALKQHCKSRKPSRNSVSFLRFSNNLYGVRVSYDPPTVFVKLVELLKYRNFESVTTANFLTYLIKIRNQVFSVKILCTFTDKGSRWKIESVLVT